MTRPAFPLSPRRGLAGIGSTKGTTAHSSQWGIAGRRRPPSQPRRHRMFHEAADDALIPLLRSVARDAAIAAGKVIRGSFGMVQQVDQAFPHDLKLWLDRASEEEILRVLRTSFPGHAVLSEERGFEPGREP